MDSIIFGYPDYTLGSTTFSYLDYTLDSTIFGYLDYTYTFGNGVVSFIFEPD